MKFTGKNREQVIVNESGADQHYLLSSLDNAELMMIWFMDDHNHLVIDDLEHQFQKNQVLFLTEFHRIDAQQLSNVRMIHFNRQFYCISDHDSEVSCRGLLFFGAAETPKVQIPSCELDKFEAIWKMLLQEMESDDNLQQEMLQVMLKRILILCTRIYKSQTSFAVLDGPKIDIVREYNYLVEQHYRRMHTVAEYAALLNKSPKTLSNIFSKYSEKTPLQFIHERKMLEARRLLRYTDKPVKEIAYELGFEDLQTFGRFFKKIEGVSPTDFQAVSA